MEQTFGGFVRQRRSSMGITLRGLAARLGLSPVYMSNIETDRKPAPTQEYLEKLAQELHLNVDERRCLLDWLQSPRNSVYRQTFRSIS